MRTIVDIDKKDLDALDEVARLKGVSRAALVRAAVSDLLGKTRLKTGEEAFGLWDGKMGDGLRYQQRLRDEW